MAQAVQGNDQARRPRLGPGLGSVPPAARARRRAERADRALRRHRPRRLGAVRRPDRDADAEAAGGRRAALLAVAHDRAVLADALVLPDRPQPPPERHGLHHRGLDRLPRRQRAHPAGVRDAGRGDAAGRLEHVLARQEPQRPGRGPPRRRHEGELAAAPGLRSLLRLPRRRDQPVVSRPRRGQPPHRAAVRPRTTAITCRRTWPTRPSR